MFRISSDLGVLSHKKGLLSGSTDQVNFAGRIHVRRVIQPWLNFKIGSIEITQMELDKKSAEFQKRADSFKNSMKEFLNTQFQIFDKKSESEENPMYYYAT